MGKQQPNLDELFPKKNPASTTSSGLDIDSLFPKKKDDTGLSGQVSSTAGSSEQMGNPRQVFGMSYADWGKKYGAIGEFAADIADVPIYFKNEIYKGLLTGAINDEIRRADASKEKPDFDKIASLRRDINSVSLPQSAMKKIEESDDYLTKAVKTVGGTIVNSLASSVGAYKSGSIGAATGAVAGAGIGSIFAPVTATAGGFAGWQAASSYANEFGGAVIDAMTEKGYDISDPKQLEKAWADKDLIESAKEKGMTRGIAIGTIDVLTQGLASKLGSGSAVKFAEKQLLKAGEEFTEQATKKIVGAATTVLEGASGSIGEATGQLLTEGKIKDWDAVALEAFVEIGGGAPSIAYNYMKAAQINSTANRENSQKIQSLQAMSESLPEGDESQAVIKSKIEALKRENDIRNNLVVETLDTAPIPTTKKVLELTNQIESFDQKLSEFKEAGGTLTDEQRQQQKSFQDIHSELTSERDGILAELAKAKEFETNINTPSPEPTSLSPVEITKLEKAINSMTEFVGDNLKALVPTFSIDSNGNYTVSVGKENKPNPDSTVLFTPEEKAQRRELDAMLDEQKVTPEEYSNKVAELNKKVVNRGIEEKKQQIAAKPQVEPTTTDGAQAATVPQTEEFVYETKPEERKQWKADFEIVDNRNGEIAPEEGETPSRWIVKNTVTGKTVGASTKAEASDIAKNPNEYNFGQGETYTRPVAAQTTTTVNPAVEASLSNVENTTKALEGLDATELANRIPDAPAAPDTAPAATPEANAPTALDGAAQPSAQPTSGYDKTNPKSVAEAYHKAKKEGTNPELVSAVESLLGKETVAEQPAGEQPTGEGYTMDTLFDNPDEMFANLEKELSDEQTAKKMGFIMKGYRSVGEALADNIITRALSKAIGSGFVGIRKVGDFSIVTINTTDKDGKVTKHELSLNNVWKGSIGYGEKAIKAMFVKALNSNNVAAKEFQHAASNFITNLTSSEGFQEARREFAGSKNNANNLLVKIGESLNNMIGNDRKALYRVHSLLDPEAFAKEPKEGRPNSVEDLSFSELKLFNALRATNDYIHEWHYRNGFLDENTYNKNKGKYFARAYKEIEDRQYADIYEAINKAGAGAEFNMFRKRKEFSEIEDLTLSDPIYITIKRMGTMAHNKAVFDFAQKVSNDPNYKSYDKLSEVPENNQKYYKKLNGNGNPQRFGDLTNKYVPIEIYEQLYGTQFISQFVSTINDFSTKYDNMFLRQLTKKLKTVGSPLTRAANVISGFSFAMMGGVDPLTLMTHKPKARKSLDSYDSWAQELTKAGLLGGQLTGMDIKKSGAQSQGVGIIKAVAGEKAAKAYQTLDKLASDTYSKVDDITKIAYYRSLVENYGYSKEAAVKMTAEQMQNYATVPNAFKLAAKLPIIGNSFIKFKPDSMRILYNSFKNRPVYGVMFVGMLAGLSKTFSKLSGESEEEREIRENRPYTTKLELGGLDVSFGWKIGDTEFNVGRYLSPYTMYDKGYKGNTISDMSEYAPLQVQYLGKNKGLGGYMPKLSDPLMGPIIQAIFDKDNNGLAIQDPGVNKGATQTVSNEQKWFNAIKYVGRSWGTPYATWADNMMSAFGEKGNYKGDVQNPLNAMLSIAIKNEKIDPEILAEKYSRYLGSMDREVGQIIGNWKSKYKRSAEDIARINAMYDAGKIKNVENRDSQIKDIEKGYSDLAIDLQGQMLEIVRYAKEPMDMINKLQQLRVKSEKQAGITKNSSIENAPSPLVKASAEAVNNAINSASDIANKALSSLGKTASETISAISNVKDKISSNVTKSSAGSVASAFDVVNKISAAASEASAKIEDVVMGVKEKISSAAAPIIEDVKQVADNPDLVLAAYQRWKDKSDESGTTKNKIILPKNIDVTKTPEFSLTGGLPYVGSDTTSLGKMRNSDSEYLSVSSIVDLNKANVGFRNRGDYKEGQGNLQANLLVPFEKPTNLSNDKMYVGIKDGKIITGRANEIKGADVVSATPFAQVVNITDKYMTQENYKFPILETLGDNQEKKLNISLSKDGKDNVNNKFAGGAVIIETPDKSQKYIVRGSLQQIKTAFEELKQNTNNKYLNMYIMDNGSFSTGLNTKDGKSSPEELKAYESKNVNGGHGIYLK